MITSGILGLAALLSVGVNACDGPTSKRMKRDTSDGDPAWSYDQSQDWGALSSDYELCMTGTQQAPIALHQHQGLTTAHNPTFNYSGNYDGHYYNWGYGPAFELAQASCTEGSQAIDCPIDLDAPNFTFEDNGVNETVYLVSWHVHTPADHSVQNDRSRAELHLVHVDSSGSERAVLAIRIDPGMLSYSDFFAQGPLPSSNMSTPRTTQNFPSFNNTEVQLNGTSTPNLALAEVGGFREMWTYRGSLTSPPCREGIRFFVARNIMFVSNSQMQDILRVSTYSARAEQEVWMHEINV